MSMYYDIKLNGKTIAEDQQGETCAELYDFIETKYGVPTYTTYALSAKEFASYLSSRHKAAVVNSNPEFNETDTLYHEAWMHLDRNDIPAEEAVSRWNAGTMLFCRGIQPADTLTVTIS